MTNSDWWSLILKFIRRWYIFALNQTGFCLHHCTQSTLDGGCCLCLPSAPSSDIDGLPSLFQVKDFQNACLHSFWTFFSAADGTAAHFHFHVTARCRLLRVYHSGGSQQYLLADFHITIHCALLISDSLFLSHLSFMTNTFLCIITNVCCVDKHWSHPENPERF